MSAARSDAARPCAASLGEETDEDIDFKKKQAADKAAVQAAAKVTRFRLMPSSIRWVFRESLQSEHVELWEVWEHVGACGIMWELPQALGPQEVGSLEDRHQALRRGRELAVVEEVQHGGEGVPARLGERPG